MSPDRGHAYSVPRHWAVKFKSDGVPVLLGIINGCPLSVEFSPTSLLLLAYNIVYMHIYCRMITTMRVNEHLHHLTWLPLFVCLVITFQIYSLSNFQGSNTVSLMRVTMLCIKFPELIHLTLKVRTLWLTSSHFPDPPAPSKHHFTLFLSSQESLWHKTLFSGSCSPASWLAGPNSCAHITVKYPQFSNWYTYKCQLMDTARCFS